MGDEKSKLEKATELGAAVAVWMWVIAGAAVISFLAWLVSIL